MYQSIPKPPTSPLPEQTPRHFTYLKNFGQIPHYVGSLEGQMPHCLALQKVPNPPLTRDYCQTFILSNFYFVKLFIQMKISYKTQPQYLRSWKAVLGGL